MEMAAEKVQEQPESELHRLTHLQSVIADLSVKALRTNRTEHVLEEGVRQAAECLGVNYCAVLELQPEGKGFLLRAGWGWNTGLAGQTVAGTGTDSDAGYALLYDEPVIIEDLPQERRFSAPRNLLDHKVVSALIVVMATSEGPYGALGAYSRVRRNFLPDEVNCLQTLANVMSSAIQRNRAETQLQRVNLLLRVLSRSNEALIRATDEPALLQRICDIVIEEAGYRFCWVGRAEKDETKSVRVLARAGFEAGYLDSLSATWADNEHGRGPTGTCIRTQRTTIARRIATDPTMGPWRTEALKRGYASSISIPIVVDAELFGAISIYSLDADAFGVEEVNVLSELASDLAYGTGALRARDERARAETELLALNAELEQRVSSRTAELRSANSLKDDLIERERTIAAEIEKLREREAAVGFRIQQNLLLDPPPRGVDGLQIAALSLPSQRIDGDFYIFIQHPGRKLDVVVGDVMGKGIPAALLGAAAKSQFLKALSSLVLGGGTLPEPRQIVAVAHADLAPHLIALDSFVTLCYTRFDVEKSTAQFVDCGHTGLVHWHDSTGACEVLHGDNLPLGVRSGEVFNQMSVPFELGDLLLFYSDGITESRNPVRQFFSIERLLECVHENARREPAAVAAALRDAVLNFSRPGALADDLTVVAVRIADDKSLRLRRELNITGDLKDLPRAREFVRGFCKEVPGVPLTSDFSAAVELAVCEAVSNIMKHAYHGRTGERIEMKAEADAAVVRIRICHSGDPFIPHKAKEPKFDGSAESGFGTYMIRHSVDEARYYRDQENKNCVELVKRRNREPEPV